jgi:hypothetical protein
MGNKTKPTRLKRLEGNPGKGPQVDEAKVWVNLKAPGAGVRGHS